MDSSVLKKRALDALKTKKKILKSAAKLFAKKGFDGISISQIAKEAKFNQSLIYHYFESKEDLWKSVKSYFVETYVNKENLKFESGKDLKSYLTQIIYNRFEFYEKYPEILRMISWQKLEEDKNKLAGGNIFSPDHWYEVFNQLQNEGKIKKDVDLDMMILFITSLITGALTDDYKNILSVQKKRKHYIDLIIENCILFFGENEFSKKSVGK